MSVSDRLNSALEHSHSPKPRDGSAFVTGFDTTTNDEEQHKRAQRAKKFGNDPFSPAANGLEAHQVDDRDGNCDVVGMELDAAADPIIPVSSVIPRENAIHLYGTDKMSTKDVLKYFSEFGPSGVEWINDSSCNVVFDSPSTTKKALANLTDPSYTPPPTDPNIKNPHLHFSPGIPYKSLLSEDNTGLMIRYATDGDVKQRGAAQKSRYYLEHGRPDDVFGLDGGVDSGRGGRKRGGDVQEWNGKRSVLDRLGVKFKQPDNVTSHSDLDQDLEDMKEQRERTYPVLPDGDLAHLLRGRRARRERDEMKSGLYSDRAGYRDPRNDDENAERRPARDDRSKSPEILKDQRKLDYEKEAGPNLEKYISRALESLQTTSTFNLHIMNSPLLPREPLVQSSADVSSTYYRTRLVVVGQIQPNQMQEVFVFALYVHEYQTFRLDPTERRELGPPVSSIYIEKVDTTGCAVFQGKRPPLARAVVGAYLRFVEDSLPALDDGPSSSDEKTEPKPRRHLLHLFARSSDQYIFNNSSKNSGKPKRDGRSLVQWWKQTVDASLGSTSSERKRVGYWYVPGAEEMDIGRSIPGIPGGSKVEWKWGWPYPSEAVARSVIPFFPDDAKCRQLEDDGIASPDTTVGDFFTLLAGCCEFTYETAGLMAIELFGKEERGRREREKEGRLEDEGVFRMAEGYLVRADCDFGSLEKAMEASGRCVCEWERLGVGRSVQVVVDNRVPEEAGSVNVAVSVVNNLQMSVRRKKK